MKDLKRYLIAGLVVLTGLVSACTKPADKPAEPKAEVKQEEKHDEHDHDDHDHEDHEHNHDHDHDHAEINPEDVSLDLWKGDWNSLDAYYDDPVVKAAIEEAAKEQNITPEEFIKNFEVRRKSDFKSLHIEGDEIVFYDGKMGEGKEITTAKYTLKEILEVPHGSRTLNWFVFETENKDVKPLLALMQIHGEEHMAHYHARYADNMDEIKDQDSKWYPTFIRTSTSSEDVAEEITE